MPKLFAGPPDQEHMRVEELNDVTAISGINLQNEQEALLASKTFLGMHSYAD